MLYDNREQTSALVVNKVDVSKSQIIITLQLWFDRNEKLFGDGFYPKLDEFNNSSFMKSRGYEDVYIKFRLNNKLQWIQIDNDNIDGLDHPFSKPILDELNKYAYNEYNKKGVCIKNRKKKRIASNFWSV